MKKKPYWYLIFPILGVLFALYYVKRASSNIVYTDYIRLVNFYLPDVYDPSKFFVPDIVTRIPLNYLGRIINVALFSYSTTFDMILGVLGLGLSAWLLTWYAIREKLSAPWFLAMILFMFSLNKWEMLTNGTGWCHFAAFAGFYYHYILADRVLTGKERKGDRIQLLIMPPILILLVSGPYCASYAVTLCLVHGMLYLIHLLKNKNLKSWHLWCLLSVLISMFFYLWSSSKADYSHSGATDLPFLTVLTQKPEMFVTFFLESFASMILGIEVIGGVIQTDTMICLLGLFVFAFYVLAFWLYFRNRLYEESYLPLFFMIAGLVNHGLVLMSRWIFLQPEYGMASRYALQYQIGILGILLTFAMVWKRVDKQYVIRTLSLVFTVMLLWGNAYTTKLEWQKAPGREAYQNNLMEMAMHYEDIPDEELITNFQYHSADDIRRALTILKEHQWNVYSYKQP